MIADRLAGNSDAIVIARYGDDGVKMAADRQTAEYREKAKLGVRDALCERTIRSLAGTRNRELMREGYVMPPTGTKCAPVVSDRSAAPPTMQKDCA